MFIKAKKSQAKARVGLIGPAGSGKTYTALVLAKTLGDKIAVIDTENNSAAKYADKFDFDVAVLRNFSPESYIKAIHEAESAGYDVIVIDGLSPAWAGTGGILQIVDDATARAKSGNAFAAGWRTATPMHNQLIDAMIQCKAHLVATMRVKTDYVMEEGPNGKKSPKKIGLAPIQRDGMEYEFDVVGDIDLDHRMVITKSRCFDMADKVVSKPDAAFWGTLKAWLQDGDAAPVPSAAPATQPQPTAPPADEFELVAKINSLVAATKTNVATLLQYYGAKTVDALSESQMQDAIAKLTKKRTMNTAAA